MDKKYEAHIGDDEGNTDRDVKLREVDDPKKIITSEKNGVLHDGDTRKEFER